MLDRFIFFRFFIITAERFYKEYLKKRLQKDWSGKLKNLGGKLENFRKNRYFACY